MSKKHKKITAKTESTPKKEISWRNHALSICLLVMVSFGVYANSLNGEFIWDDKELIVDNSYIKNWDYLSINLTKDFFFRSQDKGKVGYYRPVITLSYMLNYSLFGLNPVGYHATNLFFHTLNSIIIYLLAFSLSSSLICSLLTSLLFAVHPIHTESVSWISGRTDVIAGFFFFLSLLLYCRWDKKSFLLYVLSLCAFSLALLSKEMVITLLFLLITYDWLLKPGGFKGIKFTWYLPYVVIILLYLIGRFLVLGIGTGNEHVDNLGRLLVIFNAGKAFLFYLGRLFFPLNLNAYIMMDLSSFPHVATLTGLILIIGTTIWAWKHRDEQPLLSFTFLSYFFTFIPLFNIIPLNAPREVDFPMAERFLYIPSFSFCLLSGLILGKAIRHYNLKPSVRWVFTLIPIIFITLNFIQTVNRNRDWKKELQFYRETVEASPRSAIFRNNLGVLYKRHGDASKALTEFKEAIRLMPDLAQAYDNLGNFYGDIGLYQEAVKEFKSALTLDNQTAETHSNLGALYFKMGNYGESEREFKEAVRLKPQFAESHFNLGTVLERVGKYDEAVREYNLALRYKPELTPAHLNLGVIYLNKLSDKKMALYHLRRCIEIDPAQPQAEKIRKKLEELQG
jgi:Tfp pilus assembly protein PilF